MASQKAKQRSRKRRKPAATVAPASSNRRQEREKRRAEAARELRRGSRHSGREGDRPDGLFGPLPVSELAMLIGGAALVIGFLKGGGPVVIVGLVIIGLGVLEVTAREHFTGYRSHSTLLAAMSAVLLAAGVVAVFGAPSQRALLIVFVAPLFAVVFWLLRRRFAIARQARVARLARPSGA